MKSETIKGVMAIVMAAIIYAFTGVCIRFLTGLGLNVYSINFIELLTGLILIFYIAKIAREKIQLPTLKEFIWLALISFCHFGVTMTLFYAYNYTTIASVEFLHYTFPILTMFGAAVLLKEKLDTWKRAATVLSVGGLALIFNPAIILSVTGLTSIFSPSLVISQEMQLGNLFALLSAFPVTAMTLIGRKLKDRSVYFTTFWSTLGAAIIYLPLFVSHNSISGFEYFPYYFVFNEAAILGLQQIGYIALVSLLFMGVAAPLYYYGLRHLEASKAGILLLIEVVAAVIVAAIFYREIPTPLNAIGGLLILVSGIVVLKSESAGRMVMMTQIHCTPHTLYRIKYHFIWVPKRRQDVLVDNVAQKAREVLAEIAEQYDLEIEVMDVQENYVHVELSAPPKYAPAEIARWLKDISTREIFATFPQMEEKLWAGELWAEGYYVSTSGDGITPDVIEQYAQYQPQQRPLKPLA